MHATLLLLRQEQKKVPEQLTRTIAALTNYRDAMEALVRPPNQGVQPRADARNGNLSRRVHSFSNNLVPLIRQLHASLTV